MDEALGSQIQNLDEKNKALKKNNEDLNKYRLELIAYKQQAVKDVEKGKEDLIIEKEKLIQMQKMFESEKNRHNASSATSSKTAAMNSNSRDIGQRKKSA